MTCLSSYFRQSSPTLYPLYFLISIFVVHCTTEPVSANTISEVEWKPRFSFRCPASVNNFASFATRFPRLSTHAMGGSGAAAFCHWQRPPSLQIGGSVDESTKWQKRGKGWRDEGQGAKERGKPLGTRTQRHLVKVLFKVRKVSCVKCGLSTMGWMCCFIDDKWCTNYLLCPVNCDQSCWEHSTWNVCNEEQHFLTTSVKGLEIPTLLYYIWVKQWREGVTAARNATP